MKNRISCLSMALPLVLPLLLLSLDVYARAGGGHGGGGAGGGHGGSSWWVSLIVAPFFILYAWWVNRRINVRKRDVAKFLEQMAKKDPLWREDRLISIAMDLFMKVQTAWGAQRKAELQMLLHPQLYPSWEQQIDEQVARGEKNIMVGLSINGVRVVGAQNFIDNSKDMFTVCFDAQADDQTLRNGLLVSSDKGRFREFWTFEWERNRWTLHDVAQSAGWRRFLSVRLVFEEYNRRAEKRAS